MPYATIDPSTLRAVMHRQNRAPLDVAAAIDVSARRLQYLLSGQHVKTSAALVDALARELNVPPCVLVTDGEAPRFRLDDEPPPGGDASRDDDPLTAGHTDATAATA